MLKLENVSKYYSENGLVATGFSKVSLEFHIGEFVAITGESGSGKSTLLNVISGLDSFEEGEMFILGDPTSGFSKEELEEYRKKYIGNIFQHFNLINSYTVYQNVELVLLMSGYKKDEIANRVQEIINKVGLVGYEKTKASKLSGGQKQRVSIARALAKETPIIVADEPTGNLDSKSATEIIKLLHDLSKDKLIIIVTHNYDQVENYVTRKISMHDGRVSEDKQFSTEVSEPNDDVKPARNGSLSFKNMIRLSGRNTFNIPAKFVLLLIVFLFLCAGVIAQYSSYKNMDSAMEGLGTNNYFVDTSKDRILISKIDKTQLTDEDYTKLAAVENVKEIIKNDSLLDMAAAISNDTEGGAYLTTQVEQSDNYKGTLISGRMPEAANEGILLFSEDDGYVKDAVMEFYEKNAKVTDDHTGNVILTNGVIIVGYGYIDDQKKEELHSGMYYREAILGLNDEGLNDMRRNSLIKYCTQEITFGNTTFTSSPNTGTYKLVANSKVPQGKLYLPEEITTGVTNPVGKDVKLVNKSLYFEDVTNYKAGAVYTKANLKSLLGLSNFDEISGSVFVNPADFSTMFDKGNFQSSVIVEDENDADITAKAIADEGYKTFRVNNGVVSLLGGFDFVLVTFRTIVLVAVLVILFFIAYFITKLILKSRNTYYAIIRMIGATKENCIALLRTELFIIFNITFFTCMAFIALAGQGVINSAYLLKILSFLSIGDYVILYLLLCGMSMLLASRYSRQLFKKTAMSAHKEEV